MSCPKCKAEIGVVKHEIMLDAGVIRCLRCIRCGYWSQPQPSYAGYRTLSKAGAR